MSGEKTYLYCPWERVTDCNGSKSSRLNSERTELGRVTLKNFETNYKSLDILGHNYFTSEVVNLKMCTGALTI